MPAEISSHILDIYQNSVAAEATLVEITVTASQVNKILKIEIKDNGNGLSEKELSNVLNPFYTSKKSRKTGLGLPLFKQSALITGGTFQICSSENCGTYIESVFNTDSPDCLMFGNLKEDLSAAVLSEDFADIIFVFKSDNHSFGFDTRQVRKNKMADNIVLWKFIRRCIKENAEMLKIRSYGENFFRNKEEKHEN